MADRYKRVDGEPYVLDRRTGEVHRAKPDDLGVARLKQSTRELVVVLAFLVRVEGRSLLHRALRRG